MQSLYRRLVSTVILILGSYAMNAGNTGIKVGASLPQWEIAWNQNQPQALMASPSFAINLVQEFSLGSYLSLQLEPGYSRLAMDLDFRKAELERLANTTFPTTLPDKISYTHTLYSVRCPLLAKIAFRESGIRPYLLVGPDIDISLGAEVSTNIDTANVTLPKSIDITPQARSTVFSVIAGAGLEIQLPLSINLVMDARYVFTPSDVSSLSMFETSLGGVQANNVVIMAGLTFAL